jgi:hypothetical protein
MRGSLLRLKRAALKKCEMDLHLHQESITIEIFGNNNKPKTIFETFCEAFSILKKIAYPVLIFAQKKKVVHH